jgi:hypothetical protein
MPTPHPKWHAMPSSRGDGRIPTHWPARAVAVAGSALVLAMGSLALASAARAEFVPVPGADGAHLSLQSDPYPVSFDDLSPGSVEHWQIEASLVDDSAPLTLQFRRAGALVSNPRGLRLAVARCDRAWTSVSSVPVCAKNEAAVFGPTAARDLPESGRYDLASITHDDGKYLLVTLSLPDTPAARADRSLMGLSASLGFGLTATGADPLPTKTTTPTPTSTAGAPGPGASASGALAFTGSDATPLLLVALATLSLGTLAIVSRHRRRARRTGMRR